MQCDDIACSLLFKHISIKDKKYGSTTKKITENNTYIEDLSNEQLDNLKNKKNSGRRSRKIQYDIYG